MSDTLNENEIKKQEREKENRECYEGLLREDPNVRSLFYNKMFVQVAALCRKYKVPEIDGEEIFLDALTLTWAHITTGKYVFQGANPSTYMHQTAFYKIMAFFRKRNGNIPKELDDDYDAIIDNDLEKEATRQAIFDKTFPHLDKDCQQIIRLVAEKKTDQEIADDPNVEKYNSRGSLNRKKKECQGTMKKLLWKADFFD